MLTDEPPGFPSNKGTIPVDTVTHPAASAHSSVIMRQTIHSLFARVAELFRRKNGNAAWPSSSPARHSTMRPIDVIGLVISDQDRRLLASVCSRNRWHLLFMDTCEDARIALHRLKAPVIFCDRDLPGRGWRETVEDLAASPHRACIILVSKVVDTYLWNEVVRRGGYDVVSKPLREDDVVRAVKWAWSYWSSATRTAAIPSQQLYREIG